MASGPGDADAVAGLQRRRRFEDDGLARTHAGLDADGRDELDRVLRAAAAAGATIVVASHELERAGQLATRQVEVVAGQTREITGEAA